MLESPGLRVPLSLSQAPALYFLCHNIMSASSLQINVLKNSICIGITLLYSTCKLLGQGHTGIFVGYGQFFCSHARKCARSLAGVYGKIRRTLFVDVSVTRMMPSRPVPAIQSPLKPRNNSPPPPFEEARKDVSVSSKGKSKSKKKNKQDAQQEGRSRASDQDATRHLLRSLHPLALWAARTEI